MGTARLLVLSVAVVGLCLVTQVQATTMIYVPLERLYGMSDVVVRGTVQSHTSFWGEQGEMFTDWTVRVDEVLYGEPVELVTVRQMGGQIGERHVRIPGDASLVDGEHVVLFLVEEEGVHYLTALGQAKLTVSLQGELPTPGGVVVLPRAGAEAVSPVEATLLRDLSDVSFFAPDSGEHFRLENEILTLSQLRALSPTFAEPAPAGGVQ
jgi:hypothetical protein